MVPGENFSHGCYMEIYTNVLPKLERRQVTHWWQLLSVKRTPFQSIKGHVKPHYEL